MDHRPRNRLARWLPQAVVQIESSAEIHGRARIAGQESKVERKGLLGDAPLDTNALIDAVEQMFPRITWCYKDNAPKKAARSC